MNTKGKNSTFALVLAAAGIGSRFGGKSPKQFQELLDLPLYMWSIFTMGQLDEISYIVVATTASDVEKVTGDITNILKGTDLEVLLKKIFVIPGGDTRQASVYEGLKYLTQFSPEYVLVHDAARPFVDKSSVKDIIESITTYGAATLAIPVTDTIKLIEDKEIKETLDRSVLMSAQTPQGAKFEWLLKAHEKANAKALQVTDDAALLELENKVVRIVIGSKSNIKITVKEDMIIGQSIAKDVFGQINALLRTKNNLTSEF